MFQAKTIATLGLLFAGVNSFDWNDTYTTTEYEGRSNIDAICNMAFWNWWPIARGHCGVCTGEGCGGVASIMLDCDSDWAKLYWYSNGDCSGSPLNYTELEYYKCDLDYDCDGDYVVTMGLTGYDESGCDGDVILDADLPLAYYAAGCILQEDDDGSAYYLLMAFYEDTAYLGVFDNSNCNGTVYYWLEIDDGYCDNSTQYSFDSGETRLRGPCNYGVWNNWPVSAFYCGSATFEDDSTDSGESGVSIFLYCEADWAAIIFFTDDLCGFNGGEVFNFTFIDTFYCSKDVCEPDDIILMEFTEYEEEECDGDTLLEAVIPLAGGTVYCSNEGGFYLGVSVTEDGFFYGIYLDENCNGTVYYNATFGDGSCDNTTGFEFEPFENQVISDDFDCNIAIFNFWPLAEGYCSMCEGEGCNGTGSVNFECNDDGSATLYEYSDSDCSTEIDSEETDIAVCDSSADCEDDDLYVLGYTQYDSNDCSGDATLDATLYVAAGDLCYGFANIPWAYYASVESSIDGIYIGIYLDDECDGKLYGNLTYEDGICNEGDGDHNSSMFTFSEYTGGSSSSSDSDGATPIQFICAVVIALLSAICVVSF